MNMIFERKLAIPMEVKEMYPLTEELREKVKDRDNQIKAVLRGDDKRILLIIGPCSADNEDSVMDYISRLCPVQEKVKDKIFIIPRLYTNKPRTDGMGYKGMLHQPDPKEKPDMFKGIVATRELHMRALRETGFSCADEMLYPENIKYIDDLLAYVSVGARSVEDQQHRLTASGLEQPVGMKNPTSGDISVMLNAVCAAQHPHSFIYRGWEARSTGNPYAHAILRGYVNRHGETMPNYHFEDLEFLCREYADRSLENPGVIVDTNHANSGKDPFRQERIAKEVLASCRADGEIRKLFRGFMTESYIEDGAQNVYGGTYGKSITDACLGWERTERLIYEIADMI